MAKTDNASPEGETCPSKTTIMTPWDKREKTPFLKQKCNKLQADLVLVQEGADGVHESVDPNILTDRSKTPLL